MGAGIGVVPVGTLDALAAQVVDRIVVAAIDARMGELYWAGFHCLGGVPVANWPPGCIAPADWTIPPRIRR